MGSHLANLGVHVLVPYDGRVSPAAALRRGHFQVALVEIREKSREGGDPLRPPRV